MALLGSFIDQEVFAATQASNSSTSFAHGLPAAPDFCAWQPTASIATQPTNSYPPFIQILSDATNVTLQNSSGGNPCPPGKVISIVFHSIIR